MSLKVLPTEKTRDMFRRMAIVPFEMTIAALLVISGIASFLHFGIADPVLALLPTWEDVILNTTSILSGLLITIGVARGKGKIELAGLLFLNAVIFSRFLLYGHLLGYGSNFIQTGIFDMTVVIASAARARSIWHSHIIVRLRDINAVSDDYVVIDNHS